MEDKEIKYNGWLVSNSLLKRSFAVLGHYILAWAILAIGAFCIGMLFGVLGFLVQ